MSEDALVVHLDRDDLVVEMRVLHADRQLAGQRLEEVDVLAEERVARELHADQDDRDQLPLSDGQGQLGAPRAEVVQDSRDLLRFHLARQVVGHEDC